MPPGRKAKTQVFHAPGLWVLYFSLAAVPVFGLGELLLATTDTNGKRFAFAMLYAYLGATLGLLLLTSFLGLRRYLRQRSLVMPPSMAGSWVTAGAGTILALFLLAYFLPHPTTPYSLASSVGKLHSPMDRSSDDGSGHPDRPEPGSAKTPQHQSASQPDSEQDLNQSDTSAKPADAVQSKPARSGDNASGGGPKGGQPPSIGFQLEKGLTLLITGLLIAFVLVRFWPQIRDAWSSLGGFWRARKQRRQQRPPRRHRSSSSLELTPLPANPFQSGQASQMSLAELVRYSFNGLTHWAERHGLTTEERETPLEFAERLADREPELANEILLLGRYVSHLAYANAEPPEECVIVLRTLWSRLAS